MSMADLLAKQENKNFKVSRGQEVEGEIVAITDQEIVLDLKLKAEGVLPKKDLTPDQLSKLKVGDKLTAYVVASENESGQVLLTLQKGAGKGGVQSKWQRFIDAMQQDQTVAGRGIEVNKGGLIVEVSGVRGFLPSSQVVLSSAGDLDKMVGQELSLSVIEADSSQNRLIFSQKVNVTDEVKSKLSQLKVGDKVTGKVAAVLPFGIFVSLEDGLEGLAHVSELSWEKVEDPSTIYKVGQDVEAKVISLDHETGRVNLSVRQLTEDPFQKAAEKYQPDDVIKITVSRVNSTGAFTSLEGGLEGLIPTAKFEPGTAYKEGDSISVIVDSVDQSKRRILLSPFLTSTKGLIYK